MSNLLDIFSEKLSKPEYEVAVLAAVMMVADAAEQAQDLTENLFTNDANKLVLQAIHAVYSEGSPIDALAVSEKAKDLGISHDGKIEQHINNILVSAPTSLFNYHSHVLKLRELATRRMLRDACEQGKSIANDLSQGDADSAIAKASAIISGVESLVPSSSGAQPIIEIIADIFHEVERIQTEKMEGRYVIRGVSTGFSALDSKIGEVKNGDLVIIAARPGMGKTTLAQNIMNHIATNLKKPCLFESMEMKRHEIVLRLISSAAAVPLKTIQIAENLDGDDWERMSGSVVWLNNAPLEIHDGKFTITEILRHAKITKAKFGGVLGAIFVDYLQLIKAPQFDDKDEVGRLTYISNSLKEMAMEMNCPVFALSQLNRSLESRPNKRPKMSDLRGSGSIEQDADLILMIYRDEVYNGGKSQFHGVAEVIIGKHRAGEVGTTYLHTELDRCRFANTSFEGVEHYAKLTAEASK